MLQMFPNIPQDIVWMYVQQYSNDTEKCAQMLNLQCEKYDLHSSDVVSDSQDCNKELIPSLLKPIEITCNFSNDSNLTEQLPLINNPANDVNQNMSDKDKNNAQNEQSSLQCSNVPYDIPHHVNHDKNPKADLSLNLNNCINYQEPLTLNINVDEDDGDDCSHSWRPKFSDDTLCSDFFMPSPTVDNFQFNQISPNLEFEHSMPEIAMNPEGVHGRYSDSSVYTYFPECENAFGISSYLHFQKSQMNAIRYEVIKSKIDLSDLQEAAEKLTGELYEKMQSKIVQDIEKLNAEIIELRLECQCLCTEVDFCMKDSVLLGEVNENCYKENASSCSTGSGNATNNLCTHSPPNNNTDVPDEPNKWQCPKCTFDNHPAINVCEMCHLSKPCTPRLPPFMRPPPDACYCHPKKETLTIQS